MSCARGWTKPTLAHNETTPPSPGRRLRGDAEEIAIGAVEVDAFGREGMLAEEHVGSGGGPLYGGDHPVGVGPGVVHQGSP